MAWDFETDPEFQKKLDWIEDLMENEIEPLSHLGMAAFSTEGREKFIKPLQDRVKAGASGPATWAPSWAARAMAK
jgi:acyl-CoA dehydrogenase